MLVYNYILVKHDKYSGLYKYYVRQEFNIIKVNKIATYVSLITLNINLDC